MLNHIELLILLEKEFTTIVMCITVILSHRKNYLLITNYCTVFIAIWLWKFNHVLYVLLCSSIEWKQAHLVWSFFEGACLKIILNLPILTAVLAQELAHLLWHHVLGVRVDLRNWINGDVIIGCSPIVVFAFFWGSLLNRLVVIVHAFLVGEGATRVSLAQVGYGTDPFQALLESFLLVVIWEGLRVVLVHDGRLFVLIEQLLVLLHLLLSIDLALITVLEG